MNEGAYDAWVAFGFEKLAMGIRGAQRVLGATQRQGQPQNLATNFKVLDRAQGRDDSVILGPMGRNQRGVGQLETMPRQAATPQSAALAQRVRTNTDARAKLQESTHRFSPLADPKTHLGSMPEFDKLRHIQEKMMLTAPPRMGLQQRLQAFKRNRDPSAVRRNMEAGLVPDPKQVDATAMSGRHGAAAKQPISMPVAKWDTGALEGPQFRGQKGFNPIQVLHRGGDPFRPRPNGSWAWGSGEPGIAQNYMINQSGFAERGGADAIASYRLNKIHPMQRGPYTRQIHFNPMTDAGHEHPTKGFMSTDKWLKGGHMAPHGSPIGGYDPRGQYPADYSQYHEMVVKNQALPSNPKDMAVARMLPSSRHFFRPSRDGVFGAGEAPSTVQLQQTKGKGWRPLAGDFGGQGSQGSTYAY